MSDMAAPTTGHAPTDRLRISALCETALDLAEPLLAPGGCFLAKLRQGGDSELQIRLRHTFARVRNAKPAASPRRFRRDLRARHGLSRHAPGRDLTGRPG